MLPGPSPPSDLLDFWAEAEVDFTLEDVLEVFDEEEEEEAEVPVGAEELEDPTVDDDLGFLLPFWSLETFFKGCPKIEENSSFSPFFPDFDDASLAVTAEAAVAPPTATAVPPLPPALLAGAF